MKKELLWGPGAVAPALAASLGWICCMPILGGAVGAVGGTLGAAFMPLRPYLAALALVALAGGFYQAYRPVAACGGQDGCRAPISRARQRILLWLSAAIVLGLLTLPRWSSWVIYWTL